MELLVKQTERHGKAVDGLRGAGRAAGDVDIDRQNLVRAAPDAVVVVEDAAGAAARAIGHHDLGIGCGLKGAQGRHAHGTRHGAGVQQHIGVTGRGHDLDAKALDVKDGRDGTEDLDLAAVAAATVNAVDVHRALDLLKKGRLGLLDALVELDLGRAVLEPLGQKRGFGHGYSSFVSKSMMMPSTGAGPAGISGASGLSSRSIYSGFTPWPPRYSMPGP